MTKYYITSTLPYVNAKPHVGFALEIIQADVLARYHSLKGEEVFFNFGTDEHGQKIYDKALEEGKDPKKYVDEYAKKFESLKTALNLSYNNFIRTTDPHHKGAAQEIWKRCSENGFVEKGIYKTKYCVGCELEKQDSELVGGKCPLHPTSKLELIEEENYFFKFSKLEDKLLELYKNRPDFVVPSYRQKEITKFVRSGLQDFSISRLKEKMPWGVEVPGDDKHVMYVWFDALTNYISALGWPEDEEKFESYWGVVGRSKAVQVAGKDNLRQQSAMWQAMLIAAGLPPTKQIFIHGFITSGGTKMSKSVGNVIDPIEYVDRYGTDALRYYLLAKVSPTEDSDFTRESFEQAYQADLANGLGNLVARVATMAEGLDTFGYQNSKYTNSLWVNVSKEIESYRFDIAMSLIWMAVSGTDNYLSRERPWQLDLSDENQKMSKIVIIQEAIQNIQDIAYCLKVFLPETSEKILDIFGAKIEKPKKPLFPRLESKPKA